MWGYIIDGVLIAIIVICAIVGIVKGLIDSVLSLFGTGIAFVAGMFGAKYLSNFVNKIFGLDSFILDKLEGGAEGTFTLFGGEFSNVEVAKFCVWIVTVVIVFLIVKLAIFILAKIFESVTQKNPKLSGINRVLGMLFGIVRGGVVSVGIIAIASLLSEVPKIGSIITDKIDETKITSFAYKYVDEYIDENLTAEKVQDIIDKIVSELDDDDDSDDSTTDSDTDSGSTDAGTDAGTEGGSIDSGSTEAGTEGESGTGTEGGTEAGVEGGTDSSDPATEE